MVESKELKSLLMKVKEESEVGLQLKFQKTKIMASGPINSWQIDGGEQWKHHPPRQILFWGASHSQLMGAVVIKLRDACSLVDKL